MSSRSARFARNVGSSLAGQAALALLSFAVTPYLVRGLGLEAYGLYVLLQSAASYLQLFAFGAGGATTKFVAELGVSEGKGLRRTLGRAGSLHVGGPLVGGALLAFFARWVVARVFHVPPELVGPAVFLMRCAAAGAVFVSLVQFSSAVTQGLHRFDWNSAMNVALHAGTLLGAVFVVHHKLGVDGVARWYVLWNAVICFVWVSSLLTVLRGKPQLEGEGVDYRRFFGYSVSMWGGALAWIVTFQFDRLFLAHDASLAAVSLYAVPAGLLQRLQLIPAAISTVLMPMLSEVHSAEGTDVLRRAYLKGIRLTLFCVLGPLVGLFSLMPQFLSLWLGGHFGDASVWPARILVLAQVFLALNYVPNALAAGCGRPWYLSAVAWAQALISLFFWWLLVPRYALIGVAVGSLLAQVLPAVVYLAVVNRRMLDLGARRFLLEAVYHPAAAAALLLIFVFPLHALASTWPRLLALSAAGGGLYLAAFWRLLEPSDRKLVLDLAARRAGGLA